MKKFLILSLCICCLFACSDDEEDSPIVGTWNEMYVLGTVYDLQSGEVVGEHGYSARTTITLQNSGKLIWKNFGITSEGKYNISNNTLKFVIGSETISYTIEESSSNKLILSNEITDQEKKLKEIIKHVFIKAGYQLTGEDMIKYNSPYPEWGVKI